MAGYGKGKYNSGGSAVETLARALSRMAPQEPRMNPQAAAFRGFVDGLKAGPTGALGFNSMGGDLLAAQILGQTVDPQEYNLMGNASYRAGKFVSQVWFAACTDNKLRPIAESAYMIMDDYLAKTNALTGSRPTSSTMLEEAGQAADESLNYLKEIF